MVTKQDIFVKNLARGRIGEELIADLLRQEGWYIIPSYDYSGEDDKAPRLQGIAENLVIPDLDISKGGRRCWAEVKTKEKPTHTRATGQDDHGISLRHFRHYLKVQRITGTPVWLFIYEEVSGDILFARVQDLDEVKRIYNGNKMDNGGTVFFPRDAFTLWKNICQLEM